MALFTTDIKLGLTIHRLLPAALYLSWVRMLCQCERHCSYSYAVVNFTPTPFTALQQTTVVFHAHNS